MHDQRPAQSDARAELMAGLTARQKSIAPKYFYDAYGSFLFDAITRLPEYYPTRTEIGLLRRYGHEIAESLGQSTLLIEYGSGSATKIRLLLEALRPHIYMPLDISREHLAQSAEGLARRFPWLDVHAVCADYTAELQLPDVASGSRRVGFFPGSSIGNFSSAGAEQFLRRVRKTVGDAGALLIGVDLDKDPKVLEAAYDDCQGVTAAFNRNVLDHASTVMGARFPSAAFRHVAEYNREQLRVELYLEAGRAMKIGGLPVHFEAGERIHTEYSHKYELEGFEKLARSAGFLMQRHWVDDARYFALCLLEPAVSG